MQSMLPMANDPIIPQPGEAALVVPPVVERVSSQSSYSGVLIDARGRLTVAVEGCGCRADFGSAGDVRAVGLLLLAIADRLAAEERQAAEAAAGDLNRIVASTSTGKPN
jgi:hypothetical protein